MLGPASDLTYPYTHYGNDAAALKKALAGGEGSVLEKLKGAQRPAVLVGPGVLHRLDRDVVLKQVPPLPRPRPIPPPYSRGKMLRQPSLPLLLLPLSSLTKRGVPPCPP